MKINKVHVLTSLVIVEAIIIILIITRGFHIVYRIREVATSPLELAVDYEASDRMFEQLVKQNPKWINYRLPSPGSAPILADAAILNRTNYVRILIANGANIKDAEKSLKNVGADDAIKLIQSVATSSKQ